MYVETPSDDQSESRLRKSKNQCCKKVSSLPVFRKYLGNHKSYQKDLWQKDFRADETSFKEKIMKKDQKLAEIQPFSRRQQTRIF